MNVGSDPSLLLQLRTISAGTGDLVVSVAGELDRGNVSRLRLWLTETVGRHHPAAVTLDLSRLHFIDVAGVRTLYELHTLAAAEDCTLLVGPLHDAVCLTLSTLGLDPEFTLPAAADEPLP